MRRVLVTCLVVPLLLSACGTDEAGSGEAGRPAGTSGESSPSAQAAADDAVDTFLTLTAQQVCDVQGQVYENAEDLAAAYDSEPDYRGLDAADVRRLRHRLERDAGFSEQLNQRVARTCG